MNRTRVEYADHEWNPIVGCRCNCIHCNKKNRVGFHGDIRLNLMAKNDYHTVEARDGTKPLYVLERPMLNERGNAIGNPFGFEPTFHEYRMDSLGRLKMGNNIIVGTMTDMFAAYIPDEWIDRVMNVCISHPEHNFMFITHNPNRYVEYKLPEKKNLWYGVAVSSESDMEKCERLKGIKNLFLSFNPLRAAVNIEGHRELLKNIRMLILGRENEGDFAVGFDWVRKLVVEADYNAVPVFMLDSMKPMVKDKSMRKDIPEEMKQKPISSKLQGKLYAKCNGCGAMLRKSEMITLLARRKRGEVPKQYGFLCETCFATHCLRFGLNIPNFNKEEGSNE